MYNKQGNLGEKKIKGRVLCWTQTGTYRKINAFGNSYKKSPIKQKKYTSLSGRKPLTLKESDIYNFYLFLCLLLFQFFGKKKRGVAKEICEDV